ncbi:aminotransferase class I/II-fold pyridoxal phosphate-dependent enzyme [Nonomuraea sp. NPDC004702]
MEAALTRRTRAVVLVSPGNPTGLTIPAKVLHELAEPARDHEIMFILR